MNSEQTFHTPSFGDEEFDILPLSMAPPTHGAGTNLSHSEAMTCQVSAQQQHNQQHLQQEQTVPMSMAVDGQGTGNESFHNDTMYMNTVVTEGLPMGYDAVDEHGMSLYGVEALQQEQQQQQQQELEFQMGITTISTTASTEMLSTISQNQLSSQLGMQVVKGHVTTTSPPPFPNQTSPGMETSDDSDDAASLHQQQALVIAMKRPSPELHSMTFGKGNISKKGKVPKKKKKRDPNEPQKPVSAYALFFRDTQAAIKGQNPNASFGEVSKIVASMWDSLDEDHKNVYKKRTESAKKDYLKALAAYRASLVSKGATDSLDNSNMTTPSFLLSSSTQPSFVSRFSSLQSSGIPMSQELSPLQKKSPLLTSLMENSKSNNNNEGPDSISNQPTHITTISPSTMYSAPLNQSQQQQQQPPQQDVMSMVSNSLNMSMQQQHAVQMQLCQQASSSFDTQQYTSGTTYSTLVVTNPNSFRGGSVTSGHQPVSTSLEQRGTCLRNGCPNPVVDSPEWDNEYCSNDCVGRVYGLGSFPSNYEHCFSEVNGYRSSFPPSLW